MSSSSLPSSIDYYTLFGLPRSASSASIRSQYRKLALEYHPDKHHSLDSSSLSDDFIHVQRAWETLRDPIKRSAYDRSLEVQNTQTNIRIWTEVNFDELNQEENDGENAVYSYLCRCGSKYWMKEEELVNGKSVFECNSCSLTIKVLVEVEEYEEEINENQSDKRINQA
jgi:diphthamide biosynthesis protein 4